MSKPQNSLTTQEFAQNAGVSANTVSKWLRKGTIEGEKINGRWLISATELTKVAPPPKSPNPSSVSDKPRSQGACGSNPGQSYSIEEFSAMTYLTEFGVRKWLKEGRLNKIVDPAGMDKIDASSLEEPHVKRLIR